MKLDFKKGEGLVPTIIQDFKTQEVLMLGYMNKEALQETKDEGWVYFWSRSKKKLWMKGEKSGNRLKVKNILIDCDGDTVLIKVDLIGTNVCHTGHKTCFYRRLYDTG